jgi:hypothetical protein
MQLYPYQQDASLLLQDSLRKYGAALDASDTGVGKTVTALGVARDLSLRPLIICPKTIRSPWRELAGALGVDPLDVLNIEKIKTGRTPYLKKVGSKEWVWLLPRGSLIIYDEVQSASGYKSQNGKILGLTRAYGYKVLMLSATVADSPLKMRAVGFLLGLHQWRDHYAWCKRYGCYTNPWGGMVFVTGKQRLEIMGQINRLIFPEKGCRVRIQDLDTFPDNAVFADSYDLSERSTEEINQVYSEMDRDILNPDEGQLPITLMLRARQKTELLKVPLFAEMTTDLLEEGKSVVIFVNFRETLDSLAAQLAGQPLSLIAGGQKEEFRDENIRQFQKNETRICIAMIQAGGVGVSLHDLDGNFPRVSLISPAYNAVHVKQALGRIHRSGGKSKCLQRIIFAAGTIEEEACKAVRRKLDNLSMLNDGDLSAGLITDRVVK